MKLTSFTDYSLRVLIYLAAQPERRATIAEIARTFEISESHLTKVVHFLSQQGWLITIRGKGGGMGLGMPAAEIGIGQVVRATEGPDVPAACFGAQPDSCVITDACRLKALLKKAAEAFHAVLDEYTLADLVRNRTVLAQILQLRPVRAA